MFIETPHLTEGSAYIISTIICSVSFRTNKMKQTKEAHNVNGL